MKNHLNEFNEWIQTTITSIVNDDSITHNILNEAKGHLDHPEDLVFLEGDAGVKRAISVISSIINHPEKITIKWDGYPALIFGRDKNGTFTILDKHMFNRANTALRQLNTPEKWVANELQRGEKQRGGLVEIIKRLWPGLEQATKGSIGYYWGDLLFGQPLHNDAGLYKFRANPNGIVYTVDVQSDIGKLLTNKIAGIAVHQFLKPDALTTDEATSLNGGIGRLANNTNIAIVPSAMPVTPAIKLNKNLLSKAIQIQNTYGNLISPFMNGAPQAKSSFEQLFTTYINKKIISGDLTNLVGDFYTYFQQRPMTETMRAKLTQYFAANKQNVKVVFAAWLAIYNLKNSVVTQLDAAAADSPVKGYLQNGVQSQEGFVYQGLKFVNRMGFARQNLAARQVSENINSSNKVVVIYPGGFHPFHPGHASVYDHLLKKFPGADVYVAATNTTTERPFTFDEKKFLANQSGVPMDRFVQVKSPYSAEEITRNYDPDRTILIFALSNKDVDRATKLVAPKKDGSPSKMQPFDELAKHNSMTQNAYVYLAPTEDFYLGGEKANSASKIREKYANASDEERRDMISDLYPLAKMPKRIKKILDKVLLGINEADNPNYFGGSSMSPIPGTPRGLQPKPSHKQISKQNREMRELKKFMGH